MRHRSLAGLICPGLLLIALTLSTCTLVSPAALTLRGRVVRAEGENPVPGAIVSLRASEFQTQTGDDGSFTLIIPEQGQAFEITAWAPGHYIAHLELESASETIKLALREHHTRDHRAYEWIDPTPGSSENACGKCHPMILPQWAANAHGRAINNLRFYSFYNGTDTSGNPLDAPGYLADFPGTSGNCANCHAPGSGVDQPFSLDMNAIRNDLTSGIHCDFCHKVGGIYLDPVTHEPYPNVPGVLSMALLRPPEGEQIFIGPYPDIHDPDTYAPIFSESAFCASCHQFSFWGTEIYNSYGEWLESDYAEQGITCQDCHMPPNGDSTFALPEQGGLEHPPESIPSHFQLGLKDEAFMRSTIEMALEHQIHGGTLDLTIHLTNLNAGHHVPTDHPGRHLILLITALDSDGKPLPLIMGSRLPVWVGDLGGQPGHVFAKVLKDARTGASPVVDYWNATLIESDNRIPANETVTQQFSFGSLKEPVTLQVQVIFRRIFQPIAETYNWELSEIVLASDQLELSP